jgi:hypothetical protein
MEFMWLMLFDEFTSSLLILKKATFAVRIVKSYTGSPYTIGKKPPNVKHWGGPKVMDHGNP